MTFNINDFKNQLTYGGARPSLFQVQLSLPANLSDPVNNGIGDATGSSNPEVERKVAFLCRATSIPASTVSAIDVPYFGRKTKVAGNRTFAPWSITVMNDEDFLIRKAMEKWLAAINGHASNIKNSGVTSRPADYQATAIVRQFSKGPEELAIRAYKFVNLFPTEVSTIELDWNTTDAIEEFQVTFEYDYWEIDTSSDLGVL
ncbi:tail tube protein [uncultured Caudovirales phage]|uniref:Tail tube protein n=1 Tax=uncultured Caudovirales phage TaxID=2100421 RepID=A0A6J5M4P3_9CAUD|nr:tail tube protein [uncultured Caudovirales phage]